MQERLIHRDVKPENMLIGRRNEIVLSDFGIAAIAHSTSSMTAQASIGTVPYMAPEQIQEHPRAASDQYALGIVIYEWLTGELPFNGSFTEIFAKHLMTPPPPLRQKVPALSAEVEQVVLIALAKDPRQRFGSIQAFATALEKASQTTQQPAGAAFAETVLSERSSPQSSSPLPPTVLAAPARATPTDLKTPTEQMLAPAVAASPPMHTPPSTTVTPPTIQAAPPPTRPGQHYLNAVILGVFLSLVDMLFLHLIPIWAGVDPYPIPAQALFPIVVSLIAGVTLGKSRAALPASLLAGLIINISGFVFMLVKYALTGILPYLPSYFWVLLIFVTLAGGPLCWLAAWLRTRTRPYEE